MKNEIIKIDINSAEYPERLRNISNPPKQLYCMGNIELLQEQSVAVVGSRKYTLYGKTVANIIGRKLGEIKLPVVSGLAYGIDAYAHEGVVEVNGRAIAVLGSGIDKMTPRCNYKLMCQIIENDGLVISEYAPGFQAMKWSYPARNRIISGISEAVIVVEANFNSGALITAQCANDQGRAVYAVPGNINSQFSMGSNLLIRDGAIPLVVIDDVIRDIGYEVSSENSREEAMDEDETKIFNVIKKFNGISPDKVAEILETRVGQVNAIVTVLEIKGFVETYSGKIHLAKKKI